MKASSVKCWDCCYLASCGNLTYSGCKSFEDFRLNLTNVSQEARTSVKYISSVIQMKDSEKCLDLLRKTTKIPRDILLDTNDQRKYFFRKKEWKRVIDKEEN